MAVLGANYVNAVEIRPILRCVKVPKILVCGSDGSI